MNKKSKIFARQGDIGILYAAESDKPTGKKVEPIGGQLTLGHGSATGHRHTVSCADADMYEHTRGPIGLDLLLVVHHETEMVHPEHNPDYVPKDGKTNMIPVGTVKI